MKNYSKYYNKNSFWNKIKKYAAIAGRKLIQLALSLYYCLIDPDTSLWAKGIILGALGYFILPTDLIPDALVPLGFTDDLAVLMQAAFTIGTHLKKEHIN